MTGIHPEQEVEKGWKMARRNLVNAAYLSEIEDVEGFLLEQKEYGDDVFITRDSEFEKGKSWKEQRVEEFRKKGRKAAGKGRKKPSR